MPGTLGNRNAIRHGLTCGALPKGCGYVRRLTDELRTALEGAVIDLRGEIRIADAATIQTACRWERHAMLAQRWLRRNTDLTPDQKLAYSRDIARASAERDKCLRALGLDERPDPVRDYYRQLYDVPALPPSSNGSDAPDSPADTVGDETGDSDAGPDSIRPNAKSPSHSSPDCDAPDAPKDDLPHRDGSGCSIPPDSAGASQHSTGDAGRDSDASRGTRHDV